MAGARRRDEVAPAGDGGRSVPSAKEKSAALTLDHTCRRGVAHTRSHRLERRFGVLDGCSWAAIMRAMTTLEMTQRIAELEAELAEVRAAAEELCAAHERDRAAIAAARSVLASAVD
jgi:hypothetical protein